MGKRILFVEGDPLIVQAVNSMLEAMGHEVRLETSGADALAAFSRRPADYDLIIADVGMPDISGLLLVDRFLKMRADITILLLATTEGQAQSRARENGVRWFGMKPLALAELAETVKSALLPVPSDVFIPVAAVEAGLHEEIIIKHDVKVSS